MNISYKVKVNDNSEFEVTSEDISALDSVKVNKQSYHILDNNTSYKAEILASNFNKKTYTVNINNNNYTVNIENDLDQLIKSLGFEIGASKKVNEIKAPMPGLILDVMVKPGDEVTVDTPLLILEAMKMENSILSPR
ncbi:MAG TPA: acetyl-CoA carboxylase biotin carboxyl carrier protein subunit, partial [Flavobacteriaceae bacterium]|nr:acetyl-CoA carboxylase biotin carboxyl carrier protein subunit [Flavobacteriaceae bacterium]